MFTTFAIALAFMTETVYHEARGEPEKCQSYVAAVVKNRALDPRWENTIQGVVTEPHQFSYRANDNLTMKNEEAKEVAKKVSAEILLDQEPSFGNVLYFHTTSSSPYWVNDMEKVLTCGNHIFYND